MKKLVFVIAMGLLIPTVTFGRQDNTRQQRKDQDKTQMQQDDTNRKDKKHKQHKDDTRKMNKDRESDKNSDRKMDNYPSNDQRGNSNPTEQKHMDSTINNHR